MHLCALRKSPVRFCVAILTHVFHVLLYKVFNEYFFETTKTYLIESASLYYCSRYQELLFFVLCVFTFSFLSFLDIHTLQKESVGSNIMFIQVPPVHRCVAWNNFLMA